jgi:hypothetical protein
MKSLARVWTRRNLVLIREGHSICARDLWVLLVRRKEIPNGDVSYMNFVNFTTSQMTNDRIQAAHSSGVPTGRGRTLSKDKTIYQQDLSMVPGCISALFYEWKRLLGLDVLRQGNPKLISPPWHNARSLHD